MHVVHGNLLQLLPERSSLSTVGIFEQNCKFSNNSITYNALVGLHLERKLIFTVRVSLEITI